MYILIVDQEFLVAMEAERILTEALVCQVQIATPRDYPRELRARRYDVIVLDSSLLDGEGGEAAARLRAANARLIFTTLENEELSGLPGWPRIPVVAKPFEERTLLEAMENAAHL